MQPFRVVAGVDWADEKHDICLVDQAEGTKEFEVIDQTPEGISAWVHSLRRRFSDTQIAVCLEQSRGALIYGLMQYDFLSLVPVNPKQLARFREAIGSGAGAKDDPGDAELLSELFAKHGDRFKVWKPDTEETRLLTLLTEDRRNLVNERTAYTNELKSLLKQFFPQALSLCSTLYSSVACELLSCWSSLPELKQATFDDIRELYHSHGRASQQQLRDRWLLIEKAVPLTTDKAIVTSRQMRVGAIVCQIKELNKAISAYDEKIGKLYTQHPDHEIFDSFPGAGRVMGPRALGAFGTDRERFSSAADLQSLSGIAPVTKKSGKSLVVHRRWACNKFLLQTFHEYAAMSIKYSDWARAYFDIMKEKTGGHHAAVRALAFKWIRIIFSCWKTRTRYDEAKYVACLKRRNSPIIKRLELNTADA